MVDIHSTITVNSFRVASIPKHAMEIFVLHERYPSSLRHATWKPCYRIYCNFFVTRGSNTLDERSKLWSGNKFLIYRAIEKLIEIYGTELWEWSSSKLLQSSLVIVKNFKSRVYSMEDQNYYWTITNEILTHKETTVTKPIEDLWYRTMSMHELEMPISRVFRYTCTRVIIEFELRTV